MFTIWHDFYKDPAKKGLNEPASIGKTREKQSKTQGTIGAAFGGAPKGAPPPWVCYYLHFRLFSMYFCKSWLIISFFGGVRSEQKDFPYFLTTHLCNNT